MYKKPGTICEIFLLMIYWQKMFGQNAGAMQVNMKKATVACVSGKAKSKLKMGKKKKKGTAPHLQLHFTLLKSPKMH